MPKTELNVLLKLEGEDYEKYRVVSKHKGINIGKELFRHLLSEEYNKITANGAS